MLCAGDCAVKRVRVLVANHPRLMRELVMATVADQPDIEVVGEVRNENDLADIVEQVQPDVLIISIDFAGCGYHEGKACYAFRKWSSEVQVQVCSGNFETLVWISGMFR
jgi:DNA-binding NarL/FixJ family response regulator